MFEQKKSEREIHDNQKKKIKKNGDPKQIFTTVIFEKNKRKPRKGQTPWGMGSLTWSGIRNYQNLKLDHKLRTNTNKTQKQCEICKKNLNYSETVCRQCQHDIHGEPLANLHTDYAHDYWKSNNCPTSEYPT